jgi:DNA-directed RNA polymerase specialized sigma subunit
MVINGHHVPVTVDLVREAVEVSRRARRLATQVEAVNLRRREIIAALILAGLQQTEVARLLDLSRQRITQYVDELRASGQLPPE